MQPQSIDFVTRALFQVLPQYLYPYVEDRLREQGIEDTWELAFTRPDRENGHSGKTYELSDPAVQLKLLFYRIAGRPLLRTAPEIAEKAKVVLRLRNTFAHPSGPIGVGHATTVLFEVKGLFELLDVDAAVEELDDLLGHLRRLQADGGGDVPPDEAHEPTSEERTGSDQASAGDEGDDAGDGSVGEESDTDGSDDVDVPGTPAVPAAADVSEVAAPERDETATALDSLTIEFDTDLGDVLASSTIHKPRLLVRMRIGGAVADIPILRVSIGLMVDNDRLTLENDQVVSISAGEEFEVSAQLALDRSALMLIDQIADAQIEVVLSASGTKRTIRPENSRCKVYGPRNWRLARDGAPEATLPGFVQPQQPALAELLRDAAGILEKRTGSSALDAYQSGQERTEAIVDAIARAVHARRITYANPPAAWAEHTQRIRSAEEVLTDRMGTCLDTTVLIASALEQAGIDTQLWLLPGHIFVGYWLRQDHPSAGDVAQNPVRASNEIDRGELRLLETTSLTDPRYPGLAELHAEAHRRAGGQGAPTVDAVLDIRGARKAGIYPLPVLAIGADGEATYVEYRAEKRDLAQLVRENLPGTARKVQRDTEVPPRVETWKRELLDLSLRNRLINLTPRAAYSLAIPDEVQGAFEDMLHAGTRFALQADGGLSAHQAGRRVGYGTELDPPVLAERLVDDHKVTINIDEDNYTRALQKLASTARTVVEETGSNNLYLTLGTLHWNTDGKDLVSPLVLIPMTITSKGRGTTYEMALDETGSSTPNHSLLQRLAHDLDLAIPGLEDPEADDAGIDLDAAFRAVRNALTEHQLPFRVETRAHLGLFDFGGFRLWKDLDENWRAVVQNPLVHHLVHQPSEPFEDPAGEAGARDLDKLVAELPTTADASQARVVAEAVAGRTIVVEGPPGTGKSQTITNLIVQAMVEGKRVLFVAEKQAALEVVSRRLTAAGVSDLVLNLHDVSLKPTAVKAKIRSALDLEATFDEEGLQADRRALDARRQELVHYRHALHTKNPASMSLYSAHTRELAVGAGIPGLEVPAHVIPRLSRDELRAVEAGLTDIAAASRAVDARADHPWRMFGGPITSGSEGPLVDAVLALRDRVVGTVEAHRPMVDGLGDPDQAEALADLMSHQGLPWDLVEAISQPRWEQAVQGIEAELERFHSVPVAPLSVYHPDVLTGPLDQVRAELSEARSAFLGRRGKMRRALAPLARWERPGLTIPDEFIEQAVNELLDVRDRALHLVHSMRTVPGLPELPPSALFDPAAVQFVRDQISRLRTARDARAAVSSGPLDDAVRRVPERDRPSLAQHLREIGTLWRRVDDTAGRSWVVPPGRAPLPQLVETLEVGTTEELTPRGLALWMGLERAVEPLRRIGLDSTASQILDGAVDHVNLPLAFDKGLAQASFRERVEEGNLRSFDGMAHNKLIDGFDTLSQRVREGARSAIRARILAHREANSTKESRRKASDLRREVSGRARAPKIRPLITRYGEVISRAMPCVLVSPESAARFIPLGEPMFDIVVFDEASQITVPAAVGAMGRGRSVVVVGDSRQMPPTRFAQLTSAVAEEDADADTVPDEESILGECVAARVERHWLSNHYRSRTEELIAFSNERYYESRLATFPGPQAGRPSDQADEAPGRSRPGVRLRRVEGIFLREDAPRKMRRTNPIEAEAIVEDVLARFENADGEPSIGIVTFNMQQRDLVETRLRELGGDDVLESLDDPDGLFVKNLENVQGDERDTILFSIAFSPNAKGEVPLNFGPLNREGGERRLNVAITRAREEVVVFSSFDPAQLHAERSNSVGLQHLRDYLDLAARGVSTLTTIAQQGGAVDRHREDVAEALRSRGLQVRTAMGLSGFRVDLGVGPADGDLVLAIMLDGMAWAERATTDDRELLPRSVLTGVAGWPAVERVWLLDWIERREQVLDRLVERVGRTVEEIEAAEAAAAVAIDSDEVADDPTGSETEAEPHAVPTSATASQDGSPDSDDEEYVDPWRVTPGSTDGPSSESHRIPDEEPRYASLGKSEEEAGNAPAHTGPEPRDPRSTKAYRPWVAPEQGTVADLEAAADDPARAALMTRLLVSAVAAEYPISTDRAARLVIGSLGMKKVRAARIESLWQVVDRRQVRTDDDGYVWPTGVEASELTGYRGQPLRHLSIDDLHPLELRNVMRESLAGSRSQEQETLLRDALARLGGARLTEHIRSVLLRALQDVSTEEDVSSGQDIPTEQPGTAREAERESATPSTVTGRRRGRPRIDPEQEMQEIVDARSRATAMARNGDLDGAAEEFEAVRARLTKRQARLRKAGRDGDEHAATEARSTQFYRGEVFGELADIRERQGDAETSFYMHTLAAHDGFPPSLELIADHAEADGRIAAALIHRQAAQRGLFPWDLYPSEED